MKNPPIPGKGVRRERIEKGKGRPGLDGDGVPGVVHARVWLLVLAIGLVGVAVIILVLTLTGSPPEGPLTVDTDVASRQNVPPADRVQRPAPPSRARRPVPISSDTTLSDDSKELKGIQVFPPMGTNPPLSGIIVPDDFKLPRGYVRHYQTTDDGKQLDPILMYDPRQAPLDWRGEPIPVPPDRIVPPEQAPSGLTIRMLEMPGSEK